MENQQKWHQKPVTAVLFLIFFFPVGLYLMWKNNLWSKTTRVIVSVVFTLLIIVNVGKNESSNLSNSSNCYKISGTYSGTSQMGYTTGTAKIIIKNNCSATLSYDQGTMGSATEYGEIIVDGTKYKFKSDGRSYDLTISSNQVVLDGYNWQCIMNK